jgi:hypothetical protein
MTRFPHPVFSDASGRELRRGWVATFLVRPTANAPGGQTYRFPTLRAGESPLLWLVDHYRRAADHPEVQDSLRETALTLLRTECHHTPAESQDQILGSLLHLAGECGWDDRDVVEWLRQALDRHRGFQLAGTYQRDGLPVSLRATAWELLVGWNRAEGMVGALHRDLERSRRADGGSEDWAQLCFAELGRQAPSKAIEKIPLCFDWPEPFRRFVLRTFLTARPPDEILASHLKQAWNHCFRVLRGDLPIGDRFPRFADFSETVPGGVVASDKEFELRRILTDAGFDCWDRGSTLVLAAASAPQRQLILDLSEGKLPFSRLIYREEMEFELAVAGGLSP